MAKGNPLMSQMRGKVGDLVFTRLAGEQVTRSRNRNPKNPQTVKQMAQRAALATAVEFYTRGVKNLFKFAFENKRPGESDYNAFVRANIGVVPVQSRKSLVENNSVFGPFIMSQGSLPQPEFEFSSDYVLGGIVTTAIPAPASTLTIGQLSRAIAEPNGLQNGDIITIVAVLANDDELFSSIGEAIAAGALQRSFAPQKWVVRQFTLDFTSTALASTLDIFQLDSSIEGATHLGLSEATFDGLAYDEEYSSGLAIIASRNTPSGVKVSTSTMKLGYTTATASAIGQSAEWKKYVASTWNTSTSLDVDPENILEGSISEN